MRKPNLGIAGRLFAGSFSVLLTGAAVVLFLIGDWLNGVLSCVLAVVGAYGALTGIYVLRGSPKQGTDRLTGFADSQAQPASPWPLFRWIRCAVVTLARAGSVAAFTVTLAGFVAYPRPWCSNWSPQKRIAVEVIDVGGGAALLAFVLFIVAWALTSPRGPLPRRLGWCMWLDIASFAMFLMTPNI